MILTTLICAYYDNPLMLREQFRSIRAFPREVQEHLRVVIVDDGSPKHPAIPEELGSVPLQVYRILVDNRWGQDAARNVGVRHAETDWVLLTDMDHLVPVATWLEVMAGQFDPTCAYMFPRVSAPDMSDYKHHPNTWFMTRKLYDRMGGYDERFVGIYGSDGDFARRLKTIARIKWCKNPIIRVPSTEVADAATTAYDRKTPADTEGRARVNAERARIPNWQPLRFSFPYSRVY